MKTLMTIILSALLFAGSVSAYDFKGKKSTAGVTTVKQFKSEASINPEKGLIDMVLDAERADDKTYTLQGKIIAQLGDYDYKFEDDTGSVMVKISASVFEGVDVTEDNTVSLQGDAQIDDGVLFLEVNKIEVIK
jgi:uncharacterized protein (TIGR00156 family)